MASVELNQKQLTYIVRALEVYSSTLEEYEENPAPNMEIEADVLDLAAKLRELLPASQVVTK
jgi:hypothetical protein